ncbi:hypothetical protein KAR91_76600, partial [Candidatus Pacearchaeota archaeon]|nr:hypothetical protein [Candidatus Pacearchaeota archaeon]
TISHTASIATDYKIYSGAFRQAGVRQEKSLAKALGMASQKIPLKNKKSFIITNAGGAGALLVDRLVSKGHDVEAPLDILGTATSKDYDRELKRLERKNYTGNIIIILTPQTMSEPERTAQVIIDSKLKKNIVALFLGDKSIRQAKKILIKNKIPVITRI